MRHFTICAQQSKRFSNSLERNILLLFKQRRLWKNFCPGTYLIPPPKWPALRAEVCQQLHVPADGAVRLEQRGRELVALLPRVDRILSPQGPVRMEQGRV